MPKAKDTSKSPAKYWGLVLSLERDPKIQTKDVLEKIESCPHTIEEWIVTKEKAPSGFNHYHVYLKFVKKIYKGQSIDIFADLFGEREAVQSLKLAKAEALARYITARDHRLEGPFGKGKMVAKIAEKPVYDVIADKGARAFQEHVINLISQEPDDRAIYWFWDEEGGIGKTKLAKHLLLTRSDVYFLMPSNYDVIAALLSQYEVTGILPRTVIIGVPRDCFFTRQTYAAIEAIKDGLIQSSKHKGGWLIFNEPHVIVFANYAPREEAMSLDKWVIEEVDAKAYEERRAEDRRKELMWRQRLDVGIRRDYF